MLRRLNVLLIEDDCDGAAAIGKLCEAELPTLSLQWSDQLDDGLQRLATERFDAALINLQVQRADGLNTLARVRQANANVPIVVLAALVNVEISAEALRLGAQDFISRENMTAPLLQRVLQTAILRMDEIRALKESTDRAHESDAKMRAILNASLDCIVTLDAKGRILDFNPAAEKTLGYSLDELVGRQLSKLFLSEEMSERQLRNLRDYQEQGQGSMLGKRVETLVARKGGAAFVAEMSIQPVPLKNDLMFTVFLRDVTARHQAEEELRRYSEELERSNDDLEQYASIISHDLIAPLRAVTGFCDLLKRDYGGQLDDKADEFIQFIVDSARRMQALIDDLRTYSRVTTNKKPVERLDCQAVVHAAMDNLEVEILESGAKIVCDTLPVVIADKTQLIQIFQNLISNAIKYRADRPLEIHISADKSKDEWILSVRDNGIGFDSAQSEHIFEIFQRLHADEEQYSGTGIGLAICKRIVQRHDGQIWAESRKGEGSTFTFTLPIEPAGHEDEEQATNGTSNVR